MNELVEHFEDRFRKLNFLYKHDTVKGKLYIDKTTNIAIIADFDVFDKKNPLSYSEYTKEQNKYMYDHNFLYRFVIENEDDIKCAVDQLDILQNHKSDDIEIKKLNKNRQLLEIDPTKPEALFENAFIEAYGREALRNVKREYPILAIDGNTKWIDYYIKTQNGDIAIEQNGEIFHSPAITDKKQYKNQLLKQNSIVSYGIKLYRWSIYSMRLSENFTEELQGYLGKQENFIASNNIQISRSFKLYDHQNNILESIEIDRKNGKNSFLVVLPTGTGKTEIMISDLFQEITKTQMKALVMVPSRVLKRDIIDVFNSRKAENNRFKYITISDEVESDIVVKTYSWISRYYEKFKPGYFNYISVDEAHHAVAPTVQKAISHFTPSTLIGFTATDKRMDSKKLEDIFGKYDSKMTLTEAIKNGYLAPINAYRLRSNIDLSEIRFNGKDYVAADLQKSVIVPSRDQLIVDLLNKYFASNDTETRKQGLIFCVSIKHAEDLAKRMVNNGISAKAVSSNDNKSSSYIDDYLENKIQFLTTCSLLNEGWDSPQTSVIVMARPTMSQVLYTQQIGRGTRKHPGKDALYVIDVVDNYCASTGNMKNTPWSIHALLNISEYLAWANIHKSEYSFSKESIFLDGLYEYEKKIEKIDLFTFEKEFADHFSVEQAARELFVSTGTINSWIKNKKIVPDVELPFGRGKIYYFSPNTIENTRISMNLKLHDESTIYDDFIEFIEKGDYTMSYKIVMMLSFLKLMDHNGECSLDDLLNDYKQFYINRINSNIIAEKSGSPYTNIDFFNDHSQVKRSLLMNPFEKFERKRFMYHCKDLNRISFSSALWNKINTDETLSMIRSLFTKDLTEYYRKLNEE